MLSSKNLIFQYPKGEAMSFPDIQVTKGEATLILGESGCGKTTLLHLLAGLLRPKSGQVDIDGTTINQLSNAALDQFRGQHIGLVYQKAYFIESLTVLDNLLISPYAPSKDKAFEVAERLNIKHLLNKLPKRLSVGEQQRASIARALMIEPKLILADEPTSALDNKNCAAVVSLLKEQAERAGASLIIVTHDGRLRGDIPNIIDLSPIEDLKIG